MLRRMKKAISKQKRGAAKKAGTAAKAPRAAVKAKGQQGRPKTDDPKVTLSLRFGSDLIRKMDAWAAGNGSIGRSALVRQAVAKFVREKDSEKSS